MLLVEDQRSAEWYAARARMLTASDFAAAIGLSEHKTPLQLWREKTGRKHSEPRSPAIEWGRTQEAVAREEYARWCQLPVTETGLHRHPGTVWLGASPDGLVGDQGALEVKCPYRRFVKQNKVPLAHMPQIQGALEVLNRDWCDYVIWTPGRATCFRVHRSKAYWNWIWPMLQRFREYWLENTPPLPMARRPMFGGAITIERCPMTK